MKKILVIATVALALIACREQQQQQQTAAPAVAKKPAVVEVATRPATPAPFANSVTGKVVETMNAGNYTYMRLATTDGDVWTAVPETKVKTGETVTVAVQMVAEKFRSTSLERTFDKLVMGVRPSDVNAPAPPARVAPAPVAAASMISSSGKLGTAAQHMAAPVATGDVKVERPEGGLTIEEIWAKRKQLSDKPVVIRGEVVKSLSGIMDKNWIHLRDGSGTRAAGTDDITVTTQDVAKVGDVITVSGVVRVDKDFGAGYAYPVIIEDAKIRQ